MEESTNLYQQITRPVEARQHRRFKDPNETLDAGFVLAKWCGGDFDILDITITVDLPLGGRLIVEPGGWIIKDVNDEFYHCSDDHFKNNYVKL